MKTTLTIITSWIFVSTACFAQTTSPAPGTATGEKIGTIINTAVTTAFPAVTSLINAFWGSNKGKDISKTDLQKNVTATQDTIKAKVNSQLIKLSGISKEIVVLDKFLRPTVQMQILASEMRGKALVGNSDKNKLWASVAVDLKIVKNYMGDISTIPDDNLKLIVNTEARARLQEIKNINKDLIERLSDDVVQKDEASFLNHTNLLAETLRHVTAMVGNKLADFQADLENTVNTAKGGMGDENDLTENQLYYQKILSTTLIQK